MNRMRACGKPNFPRGHLRVHSSTGQTPHQCFSAGAAAIRHVEDPQKIEPLFYTRTERVVRKDGTVTLGKRLFEVPLALRAWRVELPCGETGTPQPRLDPILCEPIILQKSPAAIVTQNIHRLRAGGRRTVHEVLPKRFGKYGLNLHPTKTRLIAFQAPRAGSQGAKKPEANASFDFLGFIHYWEKSRKGRPTIKRKTASKKLSRRLKAVGEWMRKYLYLPIREQWEKL